MYSIVLFIVETSLSGFFGSGDSPMSAVDISRVTRSSGARPVKCTCSPSSSSTASLRRSGPASPSPIRVRATSVRPRTCTMCVHRAQRQVDPVLGAHHADVDEQVLVAAAQLGLRLAAAHAVRVGAGRTTVTSAGRLPPRVIATAR